MASSINSILGIGAGALYAHQNSIQTTGNNIANVDTEGYSRQGVRYEENPSLNAYPGQIGQGVQATEVYRMFNRFVEKAYISKSSDSARWAEQYGLLSNVDALVYESDTTPGIGGTLNKFFTGWQTLSNNGTLLSSREALLSDAQSLATFVSEQAATLSYMQQQMDGLIQADVDRANQLIQEIANLNSQINQHSVPGQNNPNALLDQRDLKARQLSEIVDIDIIDRGEGHYTVQTKSGLPLVDEYNHFALEFSGPKVNHYQSPQSAYTGTVHFEGADQYEYTIQTVSGGSIGTSAVPGEATFKVSLDAGKSWLCKDGAYRTEAQINNMSAADKAAKGFMEYEANDSSKPAFVNGGAVKIWFDGEVDGIPAGPLVGAKSNPGDPEPDKFEVVPKSGIYWKRPTGEERVNITPMHMGDGTENPRRATGGTLTAYLEFRDHLVGGYLDKLDTFAKTLAWEVNRIHSQGFGLEARNSILGDYQALNQSAALSSPYSGLAFGDRLQAGTFSLAMFDADGKPLLNAAGTAQIVVEVTFDPTTGSLRDLAEAINTAAAAQLGGSAVSLAAGITDGRLDLNSLNGGFGFVNDTTGVMAALGVNTFFKGDTAASFSVNADIVRNLKLINAAAINGGGEGNSGDTITALEMAQLGSKKVSFKEPGTGRTSEQTMLGYYSSYVTRVGADTQTAKYNATLYGTMVTDLRNQQDSNSGVNLDEEMTSLVKFQNSYKAAAKLITTADEMLQTIIGLKQ